MEEPLLAPIVTDEAESAVPDQPFNRPVRHVAVTSAAVGRRPRGYSIKLRSTHTADLSVGPYVIDSRRADLSG